MRQNETKVIGLSDKAYEKLRFMSEISNTKMKEVATDAVCMLFEMSLKFTPALEAKWSNWSTKKDISKDSTNQGLFAVTADTPKLVRLADVCKKLQEKIGDGPFGFLRTSKPKTRIIASIIKNYLHYDIVGKPEKDGCNRYALQEKDVNPCIKDLEDLISTNKDVKTYIYKSVRDAGCFEFSGVIPLACARLKTLGKEAKKHITLDVVKHHAYHYMGDDARCFANVYQRDMVIEEIVKTYNR